LLVCGGQIPAKIGTEKSEHLVLSHDVTRRFIDFDSGVCENPRIGPFRPTNREDGWLTNLPETGFLIWHKFELAQDMALSQPRTSEAAARFSRPRPVNLV